MCQRLLDGDVRQFRACATTKRTARGGDHERCDLLAWQLAKALLERGVLGVDRQDQSAASTGRGQHELASRYEALFVGEREIKAGVQRRQARLEPCRTHHGIEDEVGTTLGDECGERA